MVPSPPLPRAPRPAYSRAERLSDAAVHVAGLVAVAGAVPALIALALARGVAPQAVAGTAVYGGALALMILASALYHLVRRPGWSAVLRRLDHAAIYLKIAGTYTPFAALTGQGAGLLAAVWAGALAGAGLKAVDPGRFPRATLLLYLGLGWAGVLAGGGLMAALPGEVVALMLSGGVLYSAGVGFLLWERLPFHNTIWHILVLAASALFYAAVAVALARV
jgi:hemolysin III